MCKTFFQVSPVSLFFFCSISIHLSTRKYRTKSRPCFSHALYLNKLIKALYRNLLSQMKFSRRIKIVLSRQQEKLKDFLVVLLVSHKNKKHRSKLLCCSLSLLPLLHCGFWCYKIWWHSAMLTMTSIGVLYLNFKSRFVTNTEKTN